MDPNAKLQQLLRACREQDHVAVIGSAADLLQALLYGATPPYISPTDHNAIGLGLFRASQRLEQLTQPD